MTNIVLPEDNLDDVPARLDAIERRLAALEDARGTGTADTAPADGGNSDTFWALDGLRARYPEGGGIVYAGSVRLPEYAAADDGEGATRGGGEVRWQEGELTADLLEPDWAQHADALAALGHPVRLRLLQGVLHGMTTAQELTATEGVGSSGQVYHHLHQLTAAGWLRAVGGGRHEIPAARIVPLLVVLRAVTR